MKAYRVPLLDNNNPFHFCLQKSLFPLPRAKYGEHFFFFGIYFQKLRICVCVCVSFKKVFVCKKAQTYKKKSCKNYRKNFSPPDTLLETFYPVCFIICSL